VYVHLLMRPYEAVVVRGLPIKRIRSVRALAAGVPLAYTTRCAILDSLFNTDPLGEVTFAVPESLIDAHATVVAIDVTRGA